jgi:hypothetical protein
MGGVYTPFFVLQLPGLTFFVVMSKKNLNTKCVNKKVSAIADGFKIGLQRDSNKECLK